MSDFIFENGSEVKDVVTGFKGIIMGRVEYLTGCNQYAVSSRKLTAEGKRGEWEWIDENRLVVTGKGIKLPLVIENQIIKGFDGNGPNKI